jgi:MFS transporter, FHS family, Na+ dependent glucose transporter 1
VTDSHSSPHPAPSAVASVAGPAPLPATIGYFAAFVALGMASASLGPTLPTLAEWTRTGLASVSSLFVARSLGYLAGSLFGGRLYDRVPGHPVMATGLLGMAGMMALAPLASALWTLFVAILVLGAAEGALDVGGNTLLVWVHRDKVAPFMNGLHFFFGVGAFLSPLIIAQIVVHGGSVRLAYWTLAVLLLPAAVWLFPLPSPPAPRTATADSPGQRVDPSLILIVAFFFLYAGAEVGFGGWIYSYAVALRLSSPATAAYLTSTFWGALTAGRLLGIPLAARFPPRAVLLADLVGCLASLGLLWVSPRSLAATWVGTCGLGLAMASIFPAMLSLAQGRMRITGQVTGWFFVGASAGGMTLPWLIGQFFESAGPRATVAVLLIDMVLALGVFTVLALQPSRLVHRFGGQRP